MHVKILAKGGFLEDTGSGGNGEGGLHVRALPPRRPPPQEPAKDRDDAGRQRQLWFLTRSPVLGPDDFEDDLMGIQRETETEIEVSS